MNYFDMIKSAMNTVNMNKINLANSIINEITTEYKPLIVFGNGGSAAIANHAVADFTKGVYEDSEHEFAFPAISLCSNVPLITAISNDIGNRFIFSRQLNYLKLRSAVVLAISSSGNSTNTIDGIHEANERGYSTVALVGFDGGYIKRNNIADVCIHVDANNYGVVEDVHMMIVHMLAQEARKIVVKNPFTQKL